MNKLALLIVVGLSGCVSITPAQKQDLSAKIAKVQAATVKACGFQPDVAMVNDIIATVDPALLLVDKGLNALGAGICADAAKRALQ